VELNKMARGMGRVRNRLREASELDQGLRKSHVVKGEWLKATGSKAKGNKWG
jgi:hypothetical protein